MVHVVRLPADDTQGVVEHEHEQGHAHGGVQVGRGGVEAGDQAQQVHAENVDEHTGQQRHEAAAGLTHRVADEVLDGIDESFKEVLHASGHQGQATAHEIGHHEEHGHTDPGVEDMFEFHHLSADRDLVHVAERGE